MQAPTVAMNASRASPTKRSKSKSQSIMDQLGLDSFDFLLKLFTFYSDPLDVAGQ